MFRRITSGLNRRLLCLRFALKLYFLRFTHSRACSLFRCAGCDIYTTQALARWRSAESIRIYARMNPDIYAGWVTKSLQERASSTSTANFARCGLVIDRHEALARLQAENYAEAADI